MLGVAKNRSRSKRVSCHCQSRAAKRIGKENWRSSQKGPPHLFDDTGGVPLITGCSSSDNQSSIAGKAQVKSHRHEVATPGASRIGRIQQLGELDDAFPFNSFKPI